MGFPSLDSKVAMGELSVDALTMDFCKVTFGSITSKREVEDRHWFPSIFVLTSLTALVVIGTSLESAGLTRANEGESGKLARLSIYNYGRSFIPSIAMRLNGSRGWRPKDPTFKCKWAFGC